MQSGLTVDLICQLLIERAVDKGPDVDGEAPHGGWHLFEDADDVFQVDVPLEVHGVAGVHVDPRVGEHLGRHLHPLVVRDL